MRNEMRGLSAQTEGTCLLIQGPDGQVRLGVRSSREVERTEDDPDVRDRVALELTFETTSPDEPDDLKHYTLVYVYTHDAYDGTHSEVLEDSVVNETLVEEVLSRLGADGDARAVVEHLAVWLPDFGASLRVLLEDWDSRYVPEGYPHGQIEAS